MGDFHVIINETSDLIQFNLFFNSLQESAYKMLWINTKYSNNDDVIFFQETHKNIVGVTINIYKSYSIQSCNGEIGTCGENRNTVTTDIYYIYM